MIFATGHWQRLVPMSSDFFPSALSVMIQYLSLDWPIDNGWVAYNSLQVIAYFITVFIAGPLAILTGLGMSPALSTRFKRISSMLSIQTARSLHFLVMVWFILFIVMHVTLVFTTGMRENLNYMYASRSDDSGSVSGSSPPRWSSSRSGGSRPPRSPCATLSPSSASVTR